MEKFIIMDGNSIANRAFYALPLLSQSSGLHTNAVFGFTTMLLRFIEEEQPTHFLVAFDAGKVTFRHQDYAEYKAGRAKTPPELSEQFPLIKEVLQAFSISHIEMDGYEADDLIGTFSRLAEQNNMQVIIVTGDRDMLQLASERVTIYITRKGISEVERYTPQDIQEKYGLKPEQIIDLKGLMGDQSDNIPGVPGIGEKTGLKLLHQYGTVENVLAHVSELKGKMKENLIQHAEDAKMSKQLATIFRDVPLDVSWDQMRFGNYDRQSVFQVFRKLEFKSLLDKWNITNESLTEEMKEPSEQAEMPFTVINKDNIADLIAKLPTIKTIHVEVAGENPHQAEIIGVSFFHEQGSYYVPFAVLIDDIAELVRDWLTNAQQEKWIYDVHKAEVALAWAGIPLKGVTFDVLLAAYLLDPTDGDTTLSTLASKYALPYLPSDEDIFGKGAKFHIPELAVVSEHGCRKAMTIHDLVPRLREKLRQDEMESLYYDLELPLAAILAKMEMHGVRIDVEGLKTYGQELEQQIEELVTQIHDLAGTKFNVNSPKQLGEILFDKLGLPVIKKTKTGYSTDAEVLEKLEPYHEIVAKLLHYRQLAKLKSTYVEGLLKEVKKEQSKIHTYFRQTITATGRLSSQFPNLQNIPIRLEEGRKIRKVFVPSEENWYMFAADYSQIELRVLAHISKDENLMEAFRQGMDIHTKTAMDVFSVRADEVTADMRRQAKAVNFGIVYGISDYGLSQNLNITRKEAAQFIETYFSIFKGVRKFMDDIVKQAKEDGYVSTLLHRRRYLPEIRSSNYNVRSFAERTAMNTPIQGSAADIIKLAMVQMNQRLQEEKLRSRMLLQVHDELVFEVPEEELDIMKRIVPEVMENAIALDVPLKAEVSYGRNWYEAK